MPEGLAGLRVAVTRPGEQDDPLASALRARGAVPLCIPLIAVLPPPDGAPLRSAIRRLQRFDWLVFTSARAVSRVAALLAAEGMQIPHEGVRIAAVGPATALAVTERLGRQADAVPDQFTGAALAEAMAAVTSLQGRSVLWPRAEAAQEALGRDLIAAGAALTAPVAYRTEADAARAAELAALMVAGQVDAVLLTSPSAAGALGAALRAGGPGTRSGGPVGVVLAAIGHTTAAAAADAGLFVHVTPTDSTFPALVAALERHLQESQRDQD